MQPIALTLPSLPRLKIVDVGAAGSPDGPAYGRLMKALPCEIIGFEPIQAECDKLNALKLPGHVYLPYAIADGRLRTFYDLAPDCSSLLEPNTLLTDQFQNLCDLLRPVGTRTVETRRLDDVPERPAPIS